MTQEITKWLLTNLRASNKIWTLLFLNSQTFFFISEFVHEFSKMFLHCILKYLMVNQVLLYAIVVNCSVIPPFFSSSSDAHWFFWKYNNNVVCTICGYFPLDSYHAFWFLYLDVWYTLCVRELKDWSMGHLTGLICALFSLYGRA